MLQIVPRWRVDVRIQQGTRHTIWVNATSLFEAMKVMSAIQFTDNGLDTPDSMTVVQVGSPQSQVATFP